MKHFYFVSNNLMSKINVVYPLDTTFLEAREKTMLNQKGEAMASSLVSLQELEKISSIYSSIYTSALSTSKYIAEDRDLDIIVDERLNERVVGDLGCNDYRFLKGMQEHDFNYKLNHGESILEVQKRMQSFLEDLLKSSEDCVLIATHNIALLSLALTWCNKGFNLEDRLILDYKEEVLFDGVFHEMDLIEVVYDEGKFQSIKRLI